MTLSFLLKTHEKKKKKIDKSKKVKEKEIIRERFNSCIMKKTYV